MLFSTFHGNGTQKKKLKSGNSPSSSIPVALLLKCHEKKPALKWNKTVSSSLYHGVSMDKKNERVLYLHTQTTREFNDNRKMVFPCFYLNMLSSGMLSFCSNSVVDNIFYLVWQVPFSISMLNIFSVKMLNVKTMRWYKRIGLNTSQNASALKSSQKFKTTFHVYWIQHFCSIWHRCFMTPNNNIQCKTRTRTIFQSIFDFPPCGLFSSLTLSHSLITSYYGLIICN